MGRRVLRRLIWGYSVCLCPIKRTSGLYGLKPHININAQCPLQRYLNKFRFGFGLEPCTRLYFFVVFFIFLRFFYRFFFIIIIILLMCFVFSRKAPILLNLILWDREFSIYLALNS